MPDQLKLDYALWTTRAVSDLIAREFSITIGRSTVGNYLNSWGLPIKSQKRELMNNVSKKFKNC